MELWAKDDGQLQSASAADKIYGHMSLYNTTSTGTGGRAITRSPDGNTVENTCTGGSNDTGRNITDRACDPDVSGMLLMQLNFWWLVCGAEVGSEHVLGKVICAHGRKEMDKLMESVLQLRTSGGTTPRQLQPREDALQFNDIEDFNFAPVKNFRILPGRGVKCGINGCLVEVGRFDQNSLPVYDVSPVQTNTDSRNSTAVNDDARSWRKQQTDTEQRFEPANGMCTTAAYLNTPYRSFQTVGATAEVGTIGTGKGSRSTLAALTAVELKRWAEQHVSAGCTLVAAKFNGIYSGALVLRDALREESVAVVRQLHDANVDVWMCTGDNGSSANATALAVGIGTSRVLAEALPEDKCKLIETRRCHTAGTAVGGAVVAIGDGMNDAVALAAADVGIAMGAGIQLVVHSANVVMLNASLTDFLRLVKLSQRTVATIKRNFVWAFVFNVVCVPLAAGVFYPWNGLHIPPALGGVLMSCSSLAVVGSSLLLTNADADVELDHRPLECPPSPSPPANGAWASNDLRRESTTSLTSSLTAPVTRFVSKVKSHMLSYHRYRWFGTQNTLQDPFLDHSVNVASAVDQSGCGAGGSW
eukprot:Lankesteria_metandrocarpae@DN2044_c0_g1_i1.p1